MRISHKWSHTGTILQAQSQSHNLTSLHKISGSYPPGSAYPSHIFIFFMWPLLELSSRLSSRFHISEGLTPVSASLSHIYLTNIHSIHNMFNFTFQQSFSLHNTCTSHFNHHIILNSQTNNSHHVYSQFISHHKFIPNHT